MFDTYKLMKAIPTKELTGKTIDEAVLLFQETQDEGIKNKCYAYIFCNLFPMLLKIHHKFPSLTSAERTEECLSCTLYGMTKFNISKGAKFSTFICGNVNRSLLGMAMRANTNNKQKVWSNLVSCDSQTLTYLVNSMRDNSIKQEYEQFLTDIENSTTLSKEEIQFCKSLLEGYKTNNEIAKAMNITQKTKYIKGRNEYITTPLDEKGAAGYAGKIRNNLRKKLRENNYTLI